MISTVEIHSVFEKATAAFVESREFQTFVAERASAEFVREFVCNVYGTHYLAAQTVALCLAALPSNGALLVKLAAGIGCMPTKIDRLITDAPARVSEFFATRVPLPTLREI